MIRIYNNKTNASILIDGDSNILVTPHLYIEPKYIKVELCDILWVDHARECEECGSFMRSFGQPEQDWFLEYNDKKYLINMRDPGNKGHGGMRIKHPISDYDGGTLMVFSVKELDTEALENEMHDSAKREDYLKAHECKLLIEEAKK